MRRIVDIKKRGPRLLPHKPFRTGYKELLPPYFFAVIFCPRKPAFIRGKIYVTGKKQKRGYSMSCNPLNFSLEAASGFEPENKGFADLCLTTWLCRQKNGAGNGI